jgi:hypothetical protein
VSLCCSWVLENLPKKPSSKLKLNFHGVKLHGYVESL